MCIFYLYQYVKIYITIGNKMNEVLTHSLSILKTWTKYYMTD